VSPSERVFRALLIAYPRRTRDASAADMVQLFTDRLRNAGSSSARARVWAETIADIAVTAPRERLQRPRTAVVEGPRLESERSLGPDLAAAGSPLFFLLTIVIVISAAGPVPWLFDQRVALFGEPAGVTLGVFSATLAGLGILLMRRSRDLTDPHVQILVIGALLIPVPAAAFLWGPGAVAWYAIAATIVVLVARFRVLMALLVVPFVLWMLTAPFLIPALIGLGSQ
jgi:hypothetical protein